MAALRTTRTVSAGGTPDAKTDRTESITQFWIWLTTHQQRFRGAEHDRSPKLCDELASQFRHIHPDVVGQLDLLTGQRVIAIGSRTLAATPAVLETIKAAPDLPGWNIYLFGFPWWLQACLPKEGLQAPYEVWCTVRLADRPQAVSIYCGSSESKATARAEYASLVLDFLHGTSSPSKLFQSWTYIPAPSTQSQSRLFPANLLTSGLNDLKTVLGAERTTPGSRRN